MDEYLRNLKNEVNNRARFLMRDYQIKAEFIIIDEASWCKLRANCTRGDYINYFEQTEPTCDMFMGLKVATVNSSTDLRILEVK